jgi:hypothetical protein
MAPFTTAIAFIGPKPMQVASGIHSRAPVTGLKTAALLSYSSSTSTRSSSCAAPLKMALAGMSDYTSTAITFFTSTRVPAALIAGSSLAALFTLSARARLGRAGTTSRLQGIVLLVYHILALMALLLSLNVIVCATATSNALLLGSDNPMATSAYAFLIRELKYEFALTRWSFLTGMFSFLGCIGCRALIEFDLLKKERTRSALVVVFSFLSLFFHLFAFVNQRLVCWPNLPVMTVAVFRMYIGRSLSSRHPAELASVVTMVATIVAVISLFQQWLSWAAVEIPSEDDGVDAVAKDPALAPPMGST